VKEFRRLVVAGVVIASITLSLFLLRSQSTSTPDYQVMAQVAGAPEIIITIPSGATGSAIARILFDQGVTKSVSAYFKVAVADPRSQKVAPGSHRLTQKIAAKQALDQLLDPTRIPNLLKVFEGQWISEIATSLQDIGFSKSEINKAFSNAVLPKGFTTIEGLLFPAQYSFASDVTASQIAQSMVDRFRQDASGRDLISAQSEFSAQELLTIASIVQAEGKVQDFKQVSRVIYNRIALGMPLQMDSTIHFIKKVRGSIFLSTQSTLINSPYNTYKNRGLPPGPIGNPGALAISAAMNPTPGDWLYFITVAPSDTRFTSSFDQFNIWKALYIKNRKAGAFK